MRRFVLGLSLATLLATSVALGDATVAPPPPKATVLTTSDGSALEVWRAKGLPGARRPVVLLLPGWNCLPGDYVQLRSYLNDRGFVVALFEHDGNSELAVSSWDAWVARAMDRLAADASSPQGKTFGDVDPTRVAIMGHSLGGAVAAQVASHDARFKAVALFGPSARDVRFLARAKTIRGAVLTIDGSLDRIAPPDECSAVVAARASTPYRGELVIKDGNHPNCPGDFDTDYIRDSGRWVMKPSPIWPFVAWTYDFPIVPGIKPMPGAEQRKVAFPYLAAWFARFVAGAKDVDGWTTGARGDAALKAGVLTRSRWSDAARKGT